MEINDDCRQWLWDKLGEECKKNLKRNGFDAHLVSKVADARKLVLDMVKDYESFGFGGSLTVRCLDIVQELRGRGKTVYDHWEPGFSPEEYVEMRLRQGRCDCFCCSANAISATGEIVNVDGIGNRTSAMMFGPRKVIIVAGMNKVTKDLAAGLERVRSVAGPMRARSLNLKTPCAETGFCMDCDSPHRICRITAILHRKPMLTDVSVILVNEALGF